MHKHSLHSIPTEDEIRILFKYGNNFIHDADKRLCCIEYDAAAGYVFFRLMQARNDFPFLWFSAPVSWVQCHSLINPPETGVKVDLKSKHAI